MSSNELVSFSELVLINPKTYIGDISDQSLVSFIPMEDVTEAGIWINKQEKPLREVRSGYTSFEENDVLFAKITPCMENGKGTIAKGLTNKKGFGSTEFYVIRSKDGVDSKFIYHWTMTELFRRKAEASMIGSAGQQRVQKYFFDKFKIINLSNREQEEIANSIDEHIKASDPEQMIPPVSIMDDDFEKAVNGRVSSKAKASEMEHAARYQIRKHFNEDPVYYKKLSEKLEEILKGFEENWEELERELRRFVILMQAGRRQDDSGLDPERQAPFYDVLLEEIAGSGMAVDNDKKQKTAGCIIELVDHIAQEIRAVDFWRNADAQNILRGWIVQFLDDNDLLPFQKISKLADRLMEMAKAKHLKLTT